MIELKGKYTDAVIMIDDVESGVFEQIYSIINSPTSKGLKVIIQPDTHPGNGICVGFTMEMGLYLNPLHLGVDLNCGMLSGKFTTEKKLNLERIDTEIRNRIPMGFNIHEKAVVKTLPYDKIQQHADAFTKKYNEKFGTSYVAPIYDDKWLENKLKQIKMDEPTFWKSASSIGGGNHFVEVSKSTTYENQYWITVHSGSRNFGLKIANYWTNVAKGQIFQETKEYNDELNLIYANTNPKSLIPQKVKELKEKYSVGIHKEYLSGENMMNYLYDVIFSYQYALSSRTAMLDIIADIIGLNGYDEVISTVHNYVDFNDFIIRKGAISSYKGQKMIIPLNMRDGILLCEGKSNPDWNFSAPHGAGRIGSRSHAKNNLDLEKFKKEMKGIYSTSVCKETLDESPMAYKNSELIEKLIEPTATILDRLKPVLNIKDTGKSISWKERKQEKKKRDLDRMNERKMKRGE